MDSRDRLTGLLATWHEAFEQGQELSAVELCGDCPELADELQSYVEFQKQMDQLLEWATQTPVGAADSAGAIRSRFENLATPSYPSDTPPESAAPGTLHPLLADLLGRKGSGASDLLGRYRILRLLGQGGMGAVFLAEDTVAHRQVALKFRKPVVGGSRERFLREARAAAQLEGDHIVRIYHVDEMDGVPYFVMPFLKGESLEARLRRTPGRPLPAAEVVQIGREAALGLAAAHARGLIHRDIKPANLWLERQDDGDGFRTLVLDFGLARPLDGDQLTQPGGLLGTPGYMAPEQADGLELDARADLFSLGCVLYLLATGRPAFSGKTLSAVLRAVAEHEPPPAHEVNPTVPPPLSELIRRLLAKDPASRPESARSVAAALAQLRYPEEAAPPAPAAVRPKRRRLLRALVAAGFLLAIVGLGVAFGGQVIRFVTNRGELVIEVADPGVEVRIVRDRAVIHDKTLKREFVLTAGDGEIEVFETDGVRLMTKRFTLNRGGKTTVTVTWKELAAVRAPKGPAPNGKGGRPEAADPDRRAAEWVTSLGGVVTVHANGKQHDIGAPGGLPAGTFEVREINLRDNGNVEDDGLAHLAGLKHLKHLFLSRTRVSDAGLVHLKGMQSLTDLGLDGTRVSDAGMLHFKGMPHLAILYLLNTQISDAGLVHLKEIKTLSHLVLSETRVSDVGLAHLKEMKALTHLELNDTGVGDAGLAHLEGVKALAHLSLHGTKVTDDGLIHCKAMGGLHFLNLDQTQVGDAGLAHLKDMGDLREIFLTGTGVSDAGLAHLKGLTNLRLLKLDGTQVSDAGLVNLEGMKDLWILHLDGTRVSDAGIKSLLRLPSLSQIYLSTTRVSARGIAELRLAFPQARVTWSEPNRQVAEAVLQMGGAVHIGTKGQEQSRPVDFAKALPQDYFQVRRIRLGKGNRESMENVLNSPPCGFTMA